jgi:hypothetical protein
MYLLQVKLEQAPFHLGGGGGRPSSEKDWDSGQMPVSTMPMMTSFSKGSGSAWCCGSGRPMKSHDLVV